jgi:hypothetical protein
MASQLEEDWGPETELDTTAEFPALDVAAYEKRQGASLPAAGDSKAASDDSPPSVAHPSLQHQSLRDMEQWTASPAAHGRPSALTAETGDTRVRLTATMRRMIADEAELESRHQLLSTVLRAQADHARAYTELERTLDQWANQVARFETEVAGLRCRIEAMERGREHGRSEPGADRSPVARWVRNTAGRLLHRW